MIPLKLEIIQLVLTILKFYYKLSFRQTILHDYRDIFLTGKYFKCN